LAAAAAAVPPAAPNKIATAEVGAIHTEISKNERKRRKKKPNLFEIFGTRV
jgi:hypothetical protein